MKNMKKIIGIVIALTLVFAIFTSCSKKEEGTTAETKLKIAMITSPGGLGDKSFNDSGYEGLKRAEKDLGAEIKVVEPKDISEGEKYLSELSKMGYKLVITLDLAHADALKKVAADNPNTHYAIYNTVVDAPNVTSVVFDEHEGSFLAGALAALVTTDTNVKGINDKKVISAIGGIQSPGIDKFIVGYEEGAKYVDKDIKIIRGYANNFGDPAKGKEIALVQIEQGSDVIYQVAGGTGNGVFEACKEKGVFAIGVDSDQDYLAEGTILTSMVKRVDNTVFKLSEAVKNGTISGMKELKVGLKDNDVALSEMKYTKDMIKPEIMKKIDDIKAKIISGEIKVSDITAE